METFYAAMLDAFQLLPLGEEALPPPAVAWRALYVPTFHLDCVVEVRQRGEGGEILLIAAGRGLRDEAASRCWPRSQPPTVPPAPLVVERAPLAPSILAAFAASLAALGALSLEDMPPHDGRDGISLLGEVREGPRSCGFSAWSPTAREDPRHHGYFTALARLAVASLPPAPGRRAVEDCLGYLRP